MAPSSPKKSAKCHVRSVSLPSRSHPTALRIVEELNRVRSCATGSASGSSRAGLVGLEELYESANDFLVRTSTQQAISCNKGETCVDELLDGSVGLLDGFGVTSELVSQIREHARCIQAAIRWRNPDPSSVKQVISDYMGLRKKLRNDVKRVMSGLKQIESKIVEAASPAVDHDHHFHSVMMVLRDVNALSASVLQALLSKLQVNNKKSKWCIMSKLAHMAGATAHEDENGYEFEALDAAAALCLSSLPSKGKCDDGELKITQDKFRDLEMRIGNIEADLDGLYRRLIRTRASLLNILSQ